MPSAETETGCWFTIVYKSHGKGNPTVTSKILDPTEEDTAMSPWPCLATNTLVIKSGTDVPAAKNVRPITGGGIPMTSPDTVAHHTMRYEYAAIHKMLPKKVMMKNFRFDLFLVSGSVSHKGAMMGKEMRYTRIAFQPLSFGKVMSIGSSPSSSFSSSSLSSSVSLLSPITSPLSGSLEDETSLGLMVSGLLIFVFFCLFVVSYYFTIVSTIVWIFGR